MRPLLAILAGIAVVAAIAYGNLWRESREDRQQIADQREQQAATPSRDDATLLSTPHSDNNPPAPIPVAAANPPAIRPGSPPGAGGSSNTAAILQNVIGTEKELWKDPEYRKARLAQLRLSMPQNNPGLAQELGLSEAEVNQLFDLLAEHQLNMTGELSVMVSSANDPAGIRAFSQKQAELQHSRDEAVAALLGPGRYSQYQQYQQTLPARTRAASLGSALAQAGQPLTDAQLKPLMQALVASMQYQRQEMQALIRNGNPAEMQSQAKLAEQTRTIEAEFNRRTLDAVAPHLNTQQLAALRVQLESQTTISRAASRAPERPAQGQ